MIPILAARYWSHIALALALLASWHFHHRLIVVHAEFDAFRREVKAATVQATTDQQATNHAPAAKSQAIAEKSDAQAPAYYAAVRTAAERMRRGSPRCPSVASVPGGDHAASLDDGSADTSIMVARPKADDDLILAAAARAAQMHADAEALIAAGVAKAGDQ